MQQLFTFLLLTSTLSSPLFAGTGLHTRSYLQSGEEILSSCDNYDSCFDLFCDRLYGNVGYIYISMNISLIDCDSLPKDDLREMAIDFITNIKTYQTYYVKDTSYMLCRINNFPEIKQPIKSLMREPCKSK